MIEELLGMLFGKAGSGAQGQLLGALTGMLGGGSGGLDLGKILGQLQSAGLSDKVGSWRGSSSNQALSARDVRRAVDPGTLSSLARRAGVSNRQAADGLGKLLPPVVDRLS